ncbi:MAG: hypothetical protein AAFV01_15025 [Bacteroidota bacterium]
MSKRILLKVAAVLWVIWGLVHILAGVLTIGHEGAAKVQGIADAVDPATIAITYPDAALAVLNQHGWNLAWIGLTTTVCAPLVWKGRAWAVYVAAWVGGMADVGYFLFMDLGGFVNFVPGTVMTIVSASAIGLSFVGLRGMASASGETKASAAA